MQLKTLGGLRLTGSSFNRKKPLILLSYLTLEGEQNRAYLAQLLWGNAKQPFNSLAQAIDQLKRLAPNTIEASHSHVKALIPSDASQLINATQNQNYETATTLYTGEFLKNTYLNKISFEVEEWLLGTRERIAENAQTAFIKEAQKHLNSNPQQAKQHAEQAYTLSKHCQNTQQTLEQIYTLLHHTQSSQLKNLEQDLNELGITPTPPPTPTPTPQNNKLPSYNNNYYGRQTEQQDISHMLNQPECQLITLSGPGGIGKTRLATELSHKLSHHYQQTHFINLEPHKNPTQLPTLISQTLNLTPNPNTTPLTQISQDLKNTQTLIILDNLEHLLSTQTNQTLNTLLETTPSLNLIITSRERTNLNQEWLVPLQPLNHPQKTTTTTQEAQNYDALKLFIDRAKHANIHFKLTPQNLNTIQELIKQTAGHPLAIELAASWIQALPPETINQELKNNLDILSSSHHPQKHQAITTVFEHSYQRLNPQQQTTMQTLSNFEESFDKNAATAISNLSYPQLATLIGKSLIQTTQKENSTGRYSLHPLFKQYLNQKLQNNPKHQETKQKHANYYLNHLNQTTKKLGTPQEGNALNTIEQDLENIKKAWLHACQQQTLNYELARVLRTYFDTKARYTEGIDHFERSLKHLANDSLTKGAILNAQAFLLTRLRQLDKAQTKAEQAKNIIETHNNLEQQANVTTTQAIISSRYGNIEESIQLFEQALYYAKEINLNDRLPTYLTNLGTAQNASGQYKAASENFHKAFELLQGKQDKTQLAKLSNSLGNQFLYEGNLQNAALHFEKCINFSQEGDIRLHYLAKSNLADVLIRQREFSIAEKLIKESIDYFDSNDLPNLIQPLAKLGKLLLAKGDPSSALHYFKRCLKHHYSEERISDVLVDLRLIAEAYLKQNKFSIAGKLLSYVREHPKTEFWLKNEILTLHQNHDDFTEAQNPRSNLQTIVDTALK